MRFCFAVHAYDVVYLLQFFRTPFYFFSFASFFSLSAVSLFLSVGCFPFFWGFCISPCRFGWRVATSSFWRRRGERIGTSESLSATTSRLLASFCGCLAPAINLVCWFTRNKPLETAISRQIKRLMLSEDERDWPSQKKKPKTNEKQSDVVIPARECRWNDPFWLIRNGLPPSTAYRVECDGRTRESNLAGDCLARGRKEGIDAAPFSSVVQPVVPLDSTVAHFLVRSAC